MGTNRIPLEESIGWDIYIELKKWCKKHRTFPSVNGFRQFVFCRPVEDGGLGYTDVTPGQFRYWWNELRANGLVSIEKETKGIIINTVDVVETKNPDIAQKVRELLELIDSTNPEAAAQIREFTSGE